MQSVVALIRSTMPLAAVLGVASFERYEPPKLPAPEASQPAAKCSLRFVGQKKLRLFEDQAAYIEPSAFAANARTLFLAGNPNYVWTSGNRASLEQRNKLFGAIVGGTTRPIPAPTASPELLHDVRVAANADGSWAVVFAEADRADFRSSLANKRYWFGIVRRGMWEGLTRLPGVEGKLRTLGATDVIDANRELIFAVPVDYGFRSDVVVFRRTREGRWHTETVGTNHVAYVDLSQLADQQLALAVVRPDTLESNDRNSLFLYTYDGTTRRWAERRKLSKGGLQAVHEPRLRSLEGRIVTTWLESVPGASIRSARAQVSRALTLGDQAFTVDPSAHQVEYLHTAAGDGIWITQGPGSGGLSLRFYHNVDGQAIRMFEMKSPFVGPLKVAIKDSNLVMVGPTAGEREGAPPVSSSFLEVELMCWSV